MSKGIIYVVAITAAVAIVALLASLGKLEWKDFGVALMALVSTFFGALFAFRLDESREGAKLRSGQKAALNRALFVFGAQHNEIRITKNEMDRYPHDISCTISMNAWQSAQALHQKVEELDFLLDSSDPNILFEIHIEQIRYEQVMSLIELRNRHSIDVLQPAIEASDLRKLSSVSEEILRSSLGDRIFETAMNYTRSMRYQVDASNESIPEVAAKLRMIAKSLMPEEKFVQFESVEFPVQFDPRE